MPVLSVLSVLPVSAAPAELDVKWNLGYVGSMGNALGYENALGSLGNPSTTYRHTDVVCIEKSGTTVWFTEKGSGSSGFCARTGYSISSWKEVDGVYVIDPEGANYPGTDGVSAGIAERNGNTMTYTYTTSKDKEYLRFCFCITNDLDASGNVIYPKVYYEYTGFPGTFAEQCALDSSPVYFMPDKTVTGVRWFDGYVGSQFNDMYYVNEIRPYYSTYSYTSIITVPKAGTTISFTDSAAPFADTAVWVISSWRAAGETWVLDTDGANFTAQDPAFLTDSNGQNTYSYTTRRDNEHLRLCLHTDGTGNLPAVIWDAPEGTYNADVTANTGTASEITELTTIAVTEPSRNAQVSGSGNVGGSSAGIYVLCFTGIAYFAGYMIFKRPEKKLKEQEKCKDDKK
jgi:hypothetical protein